MKMQWIIGIVVIVVVIAGGIVMLRGSTTSSENKTTTIPSENTSATTMSDYHDNIYKTKAGPTGAYLTDFAGMALYTFDKDTAGVSNCDTTCVQKWKPYVSGATGQKTFPKDITVIKRGDGSEQFAWKHMPLYYFNGDTTDKDIKGDGVNGVWHLAKP